MKRLDSVNVSQYGCNNISHSLVCMYSNMAFITEISMMLDISGYMDLFLWNLPTTNGGKIQIV